MLSALSSPMLDEAVLAKERRRGEQGDAVTVDSICGTEPDRSRDISHRGGQRHDGNVVEHASGEIAMHDDSRPRLVHLGQPDLARPPLALALLVAMLAGAAISILVNTITVPLGIPIALVLLAIAAPTFLALRADSRNPSKTG